MQIWWLALHFWFINNFVDLLLSVYFCLWTSKSKILSDISVMQWDKWIIVSCVATIHRISFLWSCFFVTFLFFFQLSVRHKWIQYIHAMRVALTFPNSCASTAICCFLGFFVLFWLIWGSMENSGAAKKTWWYHIYLKKNTVNSSRVAIP